MDIYAYTYTCIKIIYVYMYICIYMHVYMHMVCIDSSLRFAKCGLDSRDVRRALVSWGGLTRQAPERKAVCPRLLVSFLQLRREPGQYLCIAARQEEEWEQA